MSPRRWRRVQVLFDAVADLPPDARDAALDRDTSGDDALRRDVERLLSAENAAAAFFRDLGGAIPAAMQSAPLAPGAPRANAFPKPIPPTETVNGKGGSGPPHSHHKVRRPNRLRPEGREKDR